MELDLIDETLIIGIVVLGAGACVVGGMLCDWVVRRAREDARARRTSRELAEGAGVRLTEVLIELGEAEVEWVKARTGPGPVRDGRVYRPRAQEPRHAAPVQHAGGASTGDAA